MSLTVGPLSLDPPVFLAPMAGITDLPMRTQVSKYGAGLVVSEMVASQEWVQDKRAVRAKSKVNHGPIPTSVQIAGRDARWMKEAAQLLSGEGASLIDINMGCPAKKVTTGYSGSALMRTPDFALSLIDAVVSGASCPVTLKMRLGWDHDCLNAAHIAQRAETAGIQMIVIHGRTRQQFYKGHADWHAVRDVVDAVNIPVIVNGDITDAASAKLALAQSGAAGVMIGRGAQGAPWIVAQIANDVYGAPPPNIPTGAALLDQIMEHYDAMLTFYGTELGARVSRKHLGWYLDRLNVAQAVRKSILTERDPERVTETLTRVFSDTDVERAVA